MKVFVAGGTGAIGRPSLRALLDAGHSVTAMVRSKENAAFVGAMGAQPAHVSLFAKEELKSAIDGHDAVANLASAIPPNSRFMNASAWEMNDRIRIEGASILVDASIAAGVDRFVQESVVMLYADGGDRWLDESSLLDHYPMARGNHAAEASARRFAEHCGTAVVLRFGWFYGPGAKHSEEFLELARSKGIVIQFGKASTYVSSTHVEDGGRAVAAALAVPSGTFNVCDDEPLTKKDYAGANASAAGRTHFVRAPGRLAHLLGDKTTSLTRSVRASNALFKISSGWTPTFASAREGWQHMAKNI
ncbi:NAD-dependent epimerase/dehydratase family protein [Aurantiacibacter poecillastricola]|uniref:NAD-dependent epimerase/dehydratase family protein n=1 Tax=Aurantiacibacter poecillastricola TaxID=3064385 RepID=UPI00273F104C|nr:NAD(P)-dependent oxidoreductase [Aurantiacibacter sp. 219JJ12-13]MDP5263640.1 NAD(P)-dependent oxidoreductase [Aurantiacibacter sp. 219JJ12-13]